jgi:hypothetical protein
MSDIAAEELFPGRESLRRWLSKPRRAVKNALKGKAGLLCAVAILMAGFYAYVVDWREVAASLIAGQPSYPVDPALLAEAKRLGLEYEAVSANPSLFAGKPVLWCLVRDEHTWRPVVDGNINWPVDVPGAELKPMATARMGRCRPTLGVVEASKEPGVHLLFAGHP